MLLALNRPLIVSLIGLTKFLIVIRCHFSANTTSHTKVDILNILRFKECTHQTKHLGPHFCKIATKKIAFSAISDKISSSLKGWKAKVFSQASRTILTKAVAQAIPTYYLANSLFPKHISRNLDAKFRKFWWGENEKGNSLVIKCWDSICSPTACGGLGFRRMKDYNMALCRLGSLLLTRMFSGFKFWRLSIFEGSISCMMISLTLILLGFGLMSSRVKILFLKVLCSLWMSMLIFLCGKILGFLLLISSF